MMLHQETAVSAPGKVLLAGGYLVVDRAYTGLVFGLSARIHVHIRASVDRSSSEISVRSPQFKHADWRYTYRELEDDAGIEIKQIQGEQSVPQARNGFIETTLAYVLTYISCRITELVPLSINIFADSDYYSHSPGSHDQEPAGRFLDFGVPLSSANKTGLGSSAALVTALTAALLSFYIPSEQGSSPASTTQIRKAQARVHNLAQAAHCNAQGKVGSGFDVAAAVYGSCIYRRFSPSILEDLGGLGSARFRLRLQDCIDDSEGSKIWDTFINKDGVRIGKGFRLVLCDVDCGSETPGMVKKVFAWRKENPGEAALLWETLQRGNEDLRCGLNELSSSAPIDAYENLRNIIFTNRSLIREMSKKADVPVEPLSQTHLIDACSALPGVVGGVVPGAGGFDAIVLLIRDDTETIDGLRRLLAEYHVEAVPGHASAGKVRLLGVKQEMEGIRAEDLSLYSDWKQ